MFDWLRKMRGAYHGPVNPGSRDPLDDFWYHSAVGVGNAAGAHVNHETAKRTSAVYSCVRVVSETIGSLPLPLFERLADGDKRRVTDPAQVATMNALNRIANTELTAVEFRETMQAIAMMRGTAFAEIVRLEGTGGVRLYPLSPNRLRIEVVENSIGVATLQVEYSQPGRQARIIPRDRLFILRALATTEDGLLGIDPITEQSETIGAAISSAEYANRFWANDATPSGILSLRSPVRKQEDADNIVAAWQRSGTNADRHKTRFLPFDVEYKQFGLTNEQAQFLETRRYTDIDICRIFRVQPHKIQILSDAKWANIESQNIEWLTDTLRPWLVRWEQAIYRDLLAGFAQDIFAEHNTDAVLRGDIATRYNAYQIGKNGGWLSANDIRRKENMNSIEGGDEYLTPLNMRESGAPEQAASMRALEDKRAADAPEGYTWANVIYLPSGQSRRARGR